MLVYTKFRYDFSSEVGDLLAKFSDDHETEKYKIFQSSWNSWINTEGVGDILTKECSRLQKEGYTGDVWDKMYKSARYYCKKRNEKIVETKKITIKHTNRFSSNFLKIMDSNINTQLSDDLEKNNMIKISQVDNFNEFCDNQQYEIINEMRDIKKVRGDIPEDIKEKLKKTFKNRFYKNRVNLVRE